MVRLRATQSRARANSCFMSMIHSVSRASSSVAPAHAQSVCVFAAMTSSHSSTSYAQRAIKETRTTMPREPGHADKVRAFHVQLA